MSNTAFNVYSNQKLEPYYLTPAPAEMTIKLPVSVSYARGTLLGELTASPGTFSAYASGNTDGSQFVKALLSFDTTTDASGNCFVAAVAPYGIVASSPGSAAYFRGAFRSEDIKGAAGTGTGPGTLDANAVAGPYMKVVSGSTTAGVVVFL